MKLHEAMEIINSKKTGYAVSFEKVVGSMLHSDHFPDIRSGEMAIETESEAWELAEKFAKKTKSKCVNIYSINYPRTNPNEATIV